MLDAFLRWFETRLPPYPIDREEPAPDRLLPFVWHYLRPAKLFLIFVALGSAVIAIGEVYVISFLGNIIDWLGQADRETLWQDEGGKLIWMGIFSVILLPLAVLLSSLNNYQIIMPNLPMVGRWKMHRFLLRQSQSFFADEFSGRVATKVMQTSLALREATTKMLDIFVYIVVMMASTIALFAALDWRLLIPLFLWLAYYIGMMIYVVPRLRDVSARQADARSEMTGRVVDSYTNIATVKLFSHAGREEKYARDSMDGFLETVYKQFRYVTLIEAANYLAVSLLLFAVVGMSLLFWTQGTITTGAIAVAATLVIRIFGLSHWIMFEIGGFFEQLGVLIDGQKMLSKPQEVSDAPEAPALSVPQGQIAFDKISFHYGKEGGVIENLSLDINSGERIGLVGRSGAGKTTLVNLLLRFFDVESGTIRIDGQNIGLVQQDSLRAAIGMVSQDTSLLHRSIRDNVAYGKPAATDDEVRLALKKANALDFVETLTDMRGRQGLDAHVGERGVKLSGGQRQRIAIARVFLKDAPILVLDEATSALDSEVEAAIQESLFDLMENKTVIAIAHRLSTIAALDRLVIMDQGKIIEQGTHDELIEKDGLYADLWARQTGGFLHGNEDGKGESDANAAE